MRETVKFAVICVTQLLAAHADAGGQRTQISALDFRNAGWVTGLSWNVPTKIYDTLESLKSAGNDVSSIVQKICSRWNVFRQCGDHTSRFRV